MELSGEALVHVCGWCVCSGLLSVKPDLQESFICNVVRYINLLCILQCLICLNAGEACNFFKNNVFDMVSGYLCKNGIIFMSPL